MTGSTSKAVVCRVSGADKALADAGGPALLCELIERAAKAQGTSFHVDVRAPSVYSLAAKVRVPDGRVLPELKLLSNDRRIDRASVERFATAISTAASEASRP